MSNKIIVEIHAQQVVEYCQKKEMTKAEYNRANKALMAGNDKLFADWIDTRDVIDAEEIEIIDVTEVQP